MNKHIATVAATALLSLGLINTVFAQSPTVTHRVLGQDRGHVAIVSTDGKVEWDANCPNTAHDIALLPSGNILVQTNAGNVVEMDRFRNIVWRWDAKPKAPYDGRVEIHAFQRLKNGDTMIAGGNNNRVIEVNKGGKVVWSIEQNELPGIKLFWVTRLQELPNGNRIIGNTHAGPNNPQLFEVTPDKKVVWTFKDHTIFGNDLAAAQVLDTEARR
jgi:hypothetical protein